MYQENVLCEVSVLRKSKTTGKVSEEYDLFVRDETQNGIIALQHKETVPEEKETEKRVSQTLSELSSGKSEAAEAVVDVAPIKNLVLFDRTDPEFDEDSDPDADLDL